MAKTKAFEDYLVIGHADIKDHFRMLPGSELEIEGAVLGLKPSTSYFVDTVNGLDTNDGKSWALAFKTMGAALTAVATGGTIYFRGDVREELVGSNLKFDVTIIGVGSKHHPDLPAAGYHPGAACWRPPVSPTTATPLLELRGRGWNFYNIMFDCPVDAAAIKIVENGLEGTAEYAGSHASFINCLFRQGQYGVELSGAGHNILWDGCEFFLMNNAGNTGAGIIQTSTAIALGFKNTVRNCIFSPNSSVGGNDRHIIAPWQSSSIVNNVFGTVEGTAKYIDLTGGNDNVVARNVLGGVYDTGDYVAGTSDIWLQNAVAVKATTAPDGLTLVAPAGP